MYLKFLFKYNIYVKIFLGVLLAVHSALSAQKSELTAIASVVIHTLGRVIGNGLWNPLLLSCLPTEHFGHVIKIFIFLN